MKNPVLKDEDYKRLALNCIECGKGVEGWYATFETRGVCSRKHMLDYNKKREEQRQKAYEEFCKKFNL